ncbi:DUF4258 domain-containing protein [Candidatus Parcubacteria bacterium]|nr:DUF4258 domain-containing protein [Candidatus Parcubacteria bacterium]
MQAIIKNDSNKNLFQVKSVLSKQIKTSKEYWQKITVIKHPSIKGKEKEAKKTLSSPDMIRVSNSDKKVFLYYRKYRKNYLCVVARHENGNGFIITVYITNKIKEGKQIWQKQKNKN